MSFWVILSWVFVLLLTGVNVFIFLKLKQASEQMLKMAFPNAKNMNEALAGMQGMMGGMKAGPGGARSAGIAKSFGSVPGGRGLTGPSAAGGGKNSDAQLKAAMDMLNKMKKK